MVQFKPRSVRVRHSKRRQRGGASVPCPLCGADSTVIYTRRQGVPGTVGAFVYRLRLCEGEHRFPTNEMASAPEEAK